MRKYVIEIRYNFDDRWHLLSFLKPSWTVTGAVKKIEAQRHLYASDTEFRITNSLTGESIDA